MSVNDLVPAAQALFFLDYIACGKLAVEVLKPIVESVARAVPRAVALLGGETAEMPGTYPPRDWTSPVSPWDGQEDELWTAVPSDLGILSWGSRARGP